MKVGEVSHGGQRHDMARIGLVVLVLEVRLKALPCCRLLPGDPGPWTALDRQDDVCALGDSMCVRVARGEYGD